MPHEYAASRRSTSGKSEHLQGRSNGKSTTQENAPMMGKKTAKETMTSTVRERLLEGAEGEAEANRRVAFR